MRVQIRIKSFQYKDGKIYKYGDTLVFDNDDLKTYNEAVYTQASTLNFPENYELNPVKGWYQLLHKGKKIKSFRTPEEALEYVNSQ